MRNAINHNIITCEYDVKMTSKTNAVEATRMEPLRRVSINNLIDLFTKAGRRKMVTAILEKSKLVEPTYEEVSDWNLLNYERDFSRLSNAENTLPFRLLWFGGQKSLKSLSYDLQGG